MSPESLNHSVYYKESDIYSFGILAFELLNEKDAFKMDTLKLIDAVVNQKYRPQIDKDICGPHLSKIIENCWKDNWKERWSFDDICKSLSSLYTDIKIKENSMTL